MNTIEYGNFTFSVRETKGGNYCIDAYSPAPTPLKRDHHVRFYRSTPFVDHRDILKWSQTKTGKAFFTHAIGQELVAMYRHAMSAGEIDVADAREANDYAKRAGGTVYTSREYQDLAAKYLYTLTNNPRYAMTDAWLTL